MKIKAMWLLSAFLWSNLLHAFAVTPAPFEILTPTISGTGCKYGSATAEVVRADCMVKLGFNNSVVSGAEFGFLNRKNCSLAIPVQVNSGYSIALPTVELNGFVQVVSPSEASLGAEIFFAGGKGIFSKKEFFSISQFRFIPTINQDLWSPCGGAVTVRMNVNFLVKSPTGIADSYIKLLTGVVGFSRWKRCEF
jgi:Domain of unknown function (DUF4360)